MTKNMNDRKKFHVNYCMRALFKAFEAVQLLRKHLREGSSDAYANIKSL